MIQRILIIGHGSIGKRHLRIIRESLPEAKILVLRHLPTSDVPEFADCVSDSLAKAVDFLPQVAVIAGPAPFHVDYARALVPIGCHLFIEKPIASETKGVRELLIQADTAHLVCQVGYNLRFLPSLVEFRRLIHQGWIGKALTVHCEIGQYLPDWRPGTDYREGVSARRDKGGGVLLELSHEFDYLRWIFGNARWVSAWMGKLSDLDIDVEDTAHVTIGFESMGGDREVLVSLMMDFIRRDTTRMCTVIGSEGSIRWNGLTGIIEWFKPGASAWTEIAHHPAGRDDSYRAQWAHFLDCVQSGSRPLVDGEAGLEVLNIVEGVKQSVTMQGQRQIIFSDKKK